MSGCSLQYSANPNLNSCHCIVLRVGGVSIVKYYQRTRELNAETRTLCVLVTLPRESAPSPLHPSSKTAHPEGAGAPRGGLGAFQQMLQRWRFHAPSFQVLLIDKRLRELHLVKSRRFRDEISRLRVQIFIEVASGRVHGRHREALALFLLQVG